MMMNSIPARAAANLVRSQKAEQRRRTHSVVRLNERHRCWIIVCKAKKGKEVPEESECVTSDTSWKYENEKKPKNLRKQQRQQAESEREEGRTVS